MKESVVTNEAVKFSDVPEGQPTAVTFCQPQSAQPNFEEYPGAASNNQGRFTSHCTFTDLGVTVNPCLCESADARAYLLFHSLEHL